MVLGIALCYLAFVAVVFGVFASSRPRVPLSRRRPAAGADSGLSQLTRSTTEAISSALTRHGLMDRIGRALEDAGLTTAPSEFLIFVFAGVGVALLLGILVGSWPLGLLLVLMVFLITFLLVRRLADRRRRRFADQLDGSLQLLSSSLRAGHSLLRSIDAASRESESPTSEEFARIVNETRLGRDLNAALEQTASRLRCEDLIWVGQAIAIHREVGGDLAAVLDQVGHTIRERNQIRRQVSALAAEGKLSAYILMALPFAIIGMLIFTSPAYVIKFTQHPVGYVMIVASIVMLTIGGVWMSRVVRIKF